MILAAADGSSLANPGPSGWAWYIDDAHWAAGGWAKGTNNMGELMSVLALLRATREIGEPLRILCDSQYAINCCTRWIPSWKKRGWRKADNKPVLNLDLLQEIDAELAGRNVTFQWVKGHAGHPLNEQADTLARAAATAYQQGTPVRSGPGYSKQPLAGGEPVDECAEAPAGRVAGIGDDPAGRTTGAKGDTASRVDGVAEDHRRPIEVAESPMFDQDSPVVTSHPDPLVGAPPVAQRRRATTRRSGHNQPDLLSIDPGSLAPVPTTQVAPLTTPSPTTTPTPTTTPSPTTPDHPDPALVVDITELTRELLADETQLDRERLGELMHPDFVIHQAGGAIRTRGSIMARPAALSGSIQLDVLGADHLADNVVLLRYRLKRNSEEFLCAIVWQRTRTRWQARFQQYTPVTG